MLTTSRAYHSSICHGFSVSQVRVAASRRHLGGISAASRLHLGRISTTSRPLHPEQFCTYVLTRASPRPRMLNSPTPTGSATATLPHPYTPRCDLRRRFASLSTPSPLREPMRV